MWRGTGIVAVAVAMALAVIAPPTGAQQVEIGVRAGGSATTVAWKPSPLGTRIESLQRRKAATGGVFVSVRASDRIHARVEALFAQKGFTEVDDDATSTIAVDYLEIPLFVALALRPTTERVVPEVFAGPWVAWEVRCKAAATEGTTSVSFDCDEVPGDPVLRRTLDWGLIVGAGLGVADVGPFRLSVDARYSAGLRNIDAEDEVDNINAHHRGLAATLGLALPLGR